MSFIFLNLHLFIFFLPLFIFEKNGVMWDYCNCFFQQFSSFNCLFKSDIVPSVIMFCHLSVFVFLLEFLDPPCRCLEGKPFTFNLSR
jgi:hypothetical protein